MVATLDSKQRLLSATRELLWRDSYGSVSVDDICQAAEVNKGSFYHHFTSKVELAEAAFADLWQQLRAGLDQVFSASLPPEERFRRYAALIRSFQEQGKKQAGRVLGCPYTTIGTETACTGSGPLQKMAADYNHNLCAYFAATVRDAQRLGLAVAGDADITAQHLQAFVSGTLAQARIGDDLAPFDHFETGLRRVAGFV